LHTAKASSSFGPVAQAQLREGIPTTKVCAPYGGTILAGVLLLGAGWVLLSVGARTDAKAEEPAKAAVKWEYCTLWRRSSPRTCTHIAATESFQGDSWYELAKKLKAPVRDKVEDDPTNQIVVFDFLGAQGWEMVSHSTNNGEDTFVFKRQVEK
jgi:hypothetical protein